MRLKAKDEIKKMFSILIIRDISQEKRARQGEEKRHWLEATAGVYLMRQFSLTPPFGGCCHLQMRTFTERDSLKHPAVSALLHTGVLCSHSSICIYIHVSYSRICIYIPISHSYRETHTRTCLCQCSHGHVWNLALTQHLWTLPTCQQPLIMTRYFFTLGNKEGSTQPNCSMKEEQITSCHHRGAESAPAPYV